jgi:hypothetical protein
VLAALLLAAACGSGDSRDVEPEREDATTSRAATSTAVATAASGAQADDRAAAAATPAISFPEFCARAELTITRWVLPPTLTDQIERGAIELRYRIPPGAEPLTVWMGVDIEVGDVTVGDVLAIDPAARAMFPNANPATEVPAIIMSHGFDVELDGRTRTIEVPIVLPSAASFDGASGWRWSELTPPPFAVSEPWVSATFRADGVRVRLDGEFCSPVFVPLD